MKAEKTNVVVAFLVFCITPFLCYSQVTVPLKVSGSNINLDPDPIELFPIANSASQPALLPVGTQIRIGTFIDSGGNLFSNSQIRGFWLSGTIDSNFTNFLTTTLNGAPNIFPNATDGFYDFADQTGSSFPDVGPINGNPVFTIIDNFTDSETLIFKHFATVAADLDAVPLADNVSALLFKDTAFGELVVGNFGLSFTTIPNLGDFLNFSTEAIPEPSTYLLMALGGAGLIFWRRRP